MKKYIVFLTVLLLVSVVSGKPFYGISGSLTGFSVTPLSTAVTNYLASNTSIAAFVSTPPLNMSLLYPGYDTFSALNSYAYSLSSFSYVLTSAMVKTLNVVISGSPLTTKYPDSFFPNYGTTSDAAKTNISGVSSTGNVEFAVSTLSNWATQCSSDIDSLSTQMTIINTTISTLKAGASATATLSATNLLSALQVAQMNAVFIAIGANSATYSGKINTIKNNMTSAFNNVKQGDAFFIALYKNFNASNATFTSAINNSMVGLNSTVNVFGNLLNGISNSIVNSASAQIKNNSTFTASVAGLVSGLVTPNLVANSSSVMETLSTYLSTIVGMNNVYSVLTQDLISKRLFVFTDSMSNPNTIPCGTYFTSNTSAFTAAYVQNISQCIDLETPVLGRYLAVANATATLFINDFQASAVVAARCGSIPVNNDIFNASTCYSQSVDGMTASQIHVESLVNTVMKSQLNILNSSMDRLAACSSKISNNFSTKLMSLYNIYTTCTGNAPPASSVVPSF